MAENQRIYLQNSFIIHSRSYRETSLLLDVFSRDYGKVALIAKGIRKRKTKLAGVLQPFNLLRLSWSGRSELQTMTEAELVLPSLQIRGKSLFCGFYLNELIDRFLHRHDPHPDLFAFYSAALLDLANGVDIEKVLRCFELALLDEVGYGLQLDRDPESGHEVEAESLYVYVVGQGPILSEPTHNVVHGDTLIELRQRKLKSARALAEAKRLMRSIIDFHLNGAVLQSRSLFGSKFTS